MKDYGYYCEYVPSQHGDCPERKRGTAAVDYDGKRWLYTVPRNEAGEFRAWVKGAFSGFNERRVTGRYPYYAVD